MRAGADVKYASANVMIYILKTEGSGIILPNLDKTWKLTEYFHSENKISLQSHLCVKIDIPAVISCKKRYDFNNSFEWAMAKTLNAVPEVEMKQMILFGDRNVAVL